MNDYYREELKQEEEPKPSIAQQVKGMFGGGWDKKRRNEIYFGCEPEGLHPKHKSLEHIHDIRFSKKQLHDFYGLGPKEEMAMESVTSDTRKDLIIELMDKGLTRRSAEETVDSLIDRGLLIEVHDQDSNQKMLVQR